MLPIQSGETMHRLREKRAHLDTGTSVCSPKNMGMEGVLVPVPEVSSWKHSGNIYHKQEHVKKNKDKE